MTASQLRARGATLGYLSNTSPCPRSTGAGAGCSSGTSSIRFGLGRFTTESDIDFAVKLIKEAQGIVLDGDQLPLDDARTYQLLTEAKTFGVFQLESAGMRDALKNLKPTRIQDIIAMVALGWSSDRSGNRAGHVATTVDIGGTLPGVAGQRELSPDHQPVGRMVVGQQDSGHALRPPMGREIESLVTFMPRDRSSTKLSFLNSRVPMME